jgi:hypothetical protein
MQPHRQDRLTDGDRRLPQPVSARSEQDGLRTSCGATPPGAARTLVAGCLRGRVVASVLDSARFVASGLVATACVTAVRPPAGWSFGCSLTRWSGLRSRIAGAAACSPRSPDLERGGRFGLNVVQALSERWGLERVAAGGTRVWAQIPRMVQAPAEPSGVGGARSSRRCKPSDGRAPAARRRQPAEGTS